MKQRALNWIAVDRATLAAHLQSARIDRSQALGDTSLYHCHGANGESIAIALPDGSGLIVGITAAASPFFERRRRHPPADLPPR